jgi:hypothetical protein
MEYGMGFGLSGSIHLQRLSSVHLQRLSILCSIDILCIMPFFLNSHLIRSLPEPTLLWSCANGTFNDLTAEVGRHEHMRQRGAADTQLYMFSPHGIARLDRHEVPVGRFDPIDHYPKNL